MITGMRAHCRAASASAADLRAVRELSATLPAAVLAVRPGR